MNETFDYLKMFAQFPFALRRFLQHRLTLEDAQRIVRERMEQRAENFLRMVERSVYGCPRSPYLALLKRAGCEMGDLRALVKTNGVEDALRELREQGVYVTYEEIKGRQPIRRFGQTIDVTARDFDNPFAPHDFSLPTGGSTGAATSIGIDLDHLAAMAPHEMITFAVHDATDLPYVLWRGILPDFTLAQLLRAAYANHMPTYWFSHLGWRDSKHWLKYDLATYYILAWMRLYGVRVPFPEYVGLDQPLLIARRVAAILNTYHHCYLATNISRAVRVCLAAQQAGIDLRGAVFKGGGEPTTPGKVNQLTRAGIRHIPGYAMTETGGSLGSGCAQPVDGSDVHLFKDAFALFAYPHHVENIGVTVPAFNITALLPTAPKIMLNVQIDDYGIVEERHCGCEFETYGYTTHLREIRSYSKLVGEGVTLIGNEMVRILEQVLPARFGGGPLDYQLLEQEDAQGLTRINLVISPRVEIADEQAVIHVVLDALRDSSAMGDAARTVWQNAQTLQVKRMEPVWTGRGKLMPLHIERQTPSNGSGPHS
jgi:hypothetical protein